MGGKQTTGDENEDMFPLIRHVGFIDILVSLCLISYVSIGFYKHEESRNIFLKISEVVKNDERRHVFYLLSHFLLILRFIAAVVLFFASFKEELRKQFSACFLWILIAIITVTTLTAQLCLCYLQTPEIVVIALELIFRLACSGFVIGYMRSEQEV